ncbi:hypothetical protein ACF3NS_03520 [Arsenicicoccus cauae]|uniref:hypothetical protein n=1 Tax=Arsenicicoccus cauae TaxID=2663847 RepID=UPI00370D39E4
MATRDDLMTWVHESLRQRGGSGTVVEVAKDIWQAHEMDLRQSGDLFYTWQYDMRWAATKLRQTGRLAEAEGRKGLWRLR